MPSYVVQSNGTNPGPLGEKRPPDGDSDQGKPCTQRAFTRSGVLVTAGVGENPENSNKIRDIQFRAARCVGCESRASVGCEMDRIEVPNDRG